MTPVGTTVQYFNGNRDADGVLIPSAAIISGYDRGNALLLFVDTSTMQWVPTSAPKSEYPAVGTWMHLVPTGRPEAVNFLREIMANTERPFQERLQAALYLLGVPE